MRAAAKKKRGTRTDVRAVEFAPDTGFRLVERPVPAIGPSDVLLRVDACGVCGSDRQVVRGESVPLGTAFPVILGHEVAGEVVACGEDAIRWSVGDKVVVHPFVACQTCAPCLHGQSNLCIRQACIGYTLPGGFAEYVAVPEKQLVRYPDGIHPAAAALLVDAYATPYRALVDAGMAPGLTVLVIGTGGLGLAALQLARAFDVGLVGAVSRRAGGHTVADEYGADIVVSTADGERTVARALRRWSGAAGVDVVLDTVADETTVSLALDVVRPGGTVALVGMSPDAPPLPIAKTVRRGVRVIGCYGSVQQDVEALVTWTRVDRLDPGVLVGELVTLDGIARAFSGHRTTGRFVVTPNRLST